MNPQYENARELFFQTDLTQAQIAEQLHVSRKTINLWVKDNSWQMLKRSSRNLPSFIATQCYYLLGAHIQSILSQNRPIDTPTLDEVNIICKLTRVVNTLKNRQTINESMETLTGLIDIIREKDPALAQQVAPYAQMQVEGRKELEHINENIIDNASYYEQMKLDMQQSLRDDCKNFNEQAQAEMKQWAAEHGVALPPKIEEQPA